MFLIPSEKKALEGMDHGVLRYSTIVLYKEDGGVRRFTN